MPLVEIVEYTQYEWAHLISMVIKTASRTLCGFLHWNTTQHILQSHSSLWNKVSYILQSCIQVAKLSLRYILKWVYSRTPLTGHLLYNGHLPMSQIYICTLKSPEWQTLSTPYNRHITWTQLAQACSIFPQVLMAPTHTKYSPIQLCHSTKKFVLQIEFSCKVSLRKLEDCILISVV